MPFLGIVKSLQEQPLQEMTIVGPQSSCLRRIVNSEEKEAKAETAKKAQADSLFGVQCCGDIPNKRRRRIGIFLS